MSSLSALALGRHQVAADPLQIGSSETRAMRADALVVGRRVDQKRLERREEQPRRVADARHLLGLGADGAPQFGEHEVAAGHVVAAQQAALELRDQHRPRLRLEVPEIFPQPFDGLPVARHRLPPVWATTLMFY